MNEKERERELCEKLWQIKESRSNQGGSFESGGMSMEMVIVRDKCNERERFSLGCNVTKRESEEDLYGRLL